MAFEPPPQPPLQPHQAQHPTVSIPLKQLVNLERRVAFWEGLIEGLQFVGKDNVFECIECATETYQKHYKGEA